MEDSILEKSNGATYMSFILDVEIIINREGARANLAESMVKGGNQVSNKKDQVKEAKGVPPGKQDDLKVYMLNMKPRSIFGAETRYEKDESKSLFSLEKDTPDRLDEDEIKQEKSIYDRKIEPDKEMFEKKTKVIKDSEEPDPEEVTVTPSKKYTKRRISKTERKAKVFKGKIEPIDFLECNRIFMCNHVQVKKCHFHSDSNLNCYHRKVPGSITYKHKTEKDIHISVTGLKSDPVCMNHATSSINNQSNTFYRKTNLEFTQTQKDFIYNKRFYSSGDNSQSEKSKLHNKTQENKKIKLNEKHKKTFKGSERNYVTLFKHAIQPLKKINTKTEQTISVKKTYTSSNTSQTQFDKNKDSKSRAIPKSASLPNLFFCQKFTIHNPNYICESIVPVEKQLWEHENNTFTEQTGKGLLDMKVKFFHIRKQRNCDRTKKLLTERIRNTNNIQSKAENIEQSSIKFSKPRNFNGFWEVFRQLSCVKVQK